MIRRILDPTAWGVRTALAGYSARSGRTSNEVTQGGRHDAKCVGVTYRVYVPNVLREEPRVRKWQDHVGVSSCFSASASCNFPHFFRGPFGALILRSGDLLPKSAVRADDSVPYKHKRAVVSAGLLTRGGFTQCIYPNASK